MIRVARHNPCARITQEPTAKPCRFAAATVICAGTGNEYLSCNQACDPMPLSELTGGPFWSFTTLYRLVVDNSTYHNLQTVT